MKNVLTIFAAAMLLTGTVSAAEAVAACPPKATESVAVCPSKAAKTACAEKPACPQETKSCPMRKTQGNLFNISRGLTNMITCPLEVPRCMLLRNGDVPIWGFVSGAFEGTGCAVMRAFSGVTDVLFLGFDKGRVFTPTFREFVWQSKWEPK